MLAKKSIETGEDCDNIPESMRQYLAIQAMEGKTLGGNFMGRGLTPYGSGMLLAGDQGTQGKVGMSQNFMLQYSTFAFVKTQLTNFQSSTTFLVDP